MNRIKVIGLLEIITLVLFFIVLLGLFSVKIWDPDFWWHLKTGEYIYQTKSLPQTDPFAHTSLPKDPINPTSDRQKFILTQYWLAQIIFYKIYQLFNFQGIIYLRASILTLLIYLLYKGVRREGFGHYLSICLLIPAVVIFRYGYTGERPQLFSFLFSFLLVYILEGFRLSATLYPLPAKRYTLYTIPIIMLLWANLHGGFILGIVILIGYLFSETIKYITKRFGQSLQYSLLKSLTIVSILSILFSLLNPNSYKVISVLRELENGLYKGQIAEAFSPFKFISLGKYAPELITYFILLFLISLILLINIKRLDLTDVLILIGLTTMSLSAVRLISFFTPVATIMLARYGIRTIEGLNSIEGLTILKRVSEGIRSYLRAPLTKGAFSTLLSFSLIIVLIKGGLFNKGIKNENYPTGAIRFLKNNHIPGNMFNPYVWGGYLIWELYPDYKVFTDGRGLIEEIFFQQAKIMEAYPRDFGGIPEWKAFLKVYRVNFIVTFSVGQFVGRLVPLIPALLKDPEWHLIYMDDNSLIFLRENPQNMEMIKRFGMPKEWAWNEVAVEAGIKARDFRRNINFYITMGDAFFAKKSYKDAKVAYLKAKEIAPYNRIVIERLETLKTYGY